MASLRERITIFQRTQKLCTTHPTLIRAVEESIANEIFYPNDVDFPELPVRYDTPCSISVTGNKSFQAACSYSDARVCVLNFASAGTPGGGVVNGATAQEEDLCRTSTLYPNLNAEKVRTPFHDRHMQMFKDGTMDYRYNDECIYTPGVVVIRDDMAQKDVLPEDQWKSVDVITCAAPNLTRQNDVMTMEELSELFQKRFRRIMTIAALRGADVLILGAFGCGAFWNPPEIVANAAKSVLPEFRHCFRQIEFAVWPADGKNFSVFQQVLAE